MEKLGEVQYSLALDSLIKNIDNIGNTILLRVMSVRKY